MNPPAEQLIRDYLNQMSIAARSRLGFLERQMLLNQTRARIKAQCGDPATASVAEVKKALAALGDPVAVIEAARARLSMRKPAAVRALLPTLVAASESASDGAGAAGGAAGRRRVRIPVHLFIPRPTTPPDPVDQPPVYGDPAKNGAGGAMRESSGGGLAPGTRRVVEAAGAAVGGLGRLVLGLGSMARRHKLETLAILLLGVGGVIFPPVWLLGAILALGSRVWDIRDKWLGLALPILGTIVGAALIVVAGGQRGSLVSYAYEAWLGAGRLVRVLVGLSAAYLLWRLWRGPRKPKLPPWNVPHKLDL